MCTGSVFFFGLRSSRLCGGLSGAPAGQIIAGNGLRIRQDLDGAFYNKAVCVLYGKGGAAGRNAEEAHAVGIVNRNALILHMHRVFLCCVFTEGHIQLIGSFIDTLPGNQPVVGPCDGHCQRILPILHTAGRLCLRHRIRQLCIFRQHFDGPLNREPCRRNNEGGTSNLCADQFKYSIVVVLYICHFNGLTGRVRVCHLFYRHGNLLICNQ